MLLFLRGCHNPKIHCPVVLQWLSEHSLICPINLQSSNWSLICQLDLPSVQSIHNPSTWPPILLLNFRSIRSIFNPPINPWSISNLSLESSLSSICWLPSTQRDLHSHNRSRPKFPWHLDLHQAQPPLIRHLDHRLDHGSALDTGMPS